MQHACHHAMGAGVGYGGGPMSTSLFSGFGPMEMMGLLFAGLLAAALLLLWAAQRGLPARAEDGTFAGGERPWHGEEPGPRVTYARYDQPPQMYEVRYEQPEAHYPDMPLDGPRAGEPGQYD